ncbi:MAG: hypothetical protein OEZ22_03850 [Spirochaetia bacterium]|nr:hypothetical protein [Spirochaetia bacterium]
MAKTKHLSEENFMALLQHSLDKKSFNNNKNILNTLSHLEKCAVCFAGFWESYDTLNILKTKKISLLTKLSIELNGIAQTFSLKNIQSFLPVSFTPAAAVRNNSDKDFFSEGKIKIIEKKLPGTVFSLQIKTKPKVLYFVWNIKGEYKRLVDLCFYVNNKEEEKQSGFTKPLEFIFSHETKKRTADTNLFFTIKYLDSREKTNERKIFEINITK